jgi:hypothetical protein
MILSILNWRFFVVVTETNVNKSHPNFKIFVLIHNDDTSIMQKLNSRGLV